MRSKPSPSSVRDDAVEFRGCHGRRAHRHPVGKDVGGDYGQDDEDFHDVESIATMTFIAPYYCKVRRVSTTISAQSMMPFPNIDPVFLRLGPLQFRWYGLMYLIGLTTAYFVIKARAAARGIAMTKEQLYDLIVYGAVGVFAGGRLGYVLFYNLPYYLEHPSKILAVWEGGMSFSGGLLGGRWSLCLFAGGRAFRSIPLRDLVAIQGSHRARVRPARQLHQRRLLWTADRRHVVHGCSEWRTGMLGIPGATL